MMAREYVDDDDDDDFFASLGIRPVPGDRPSSSRGRGAAAGAGAGAGSGVGGFGAGQFEADASLFQPAPLLWHELKANLQPAEEHEVATIIGSDLIDRNQTLFAEAEAYAQILQDFHAENVALQEAVSRRPRLGATRTHKMLGQQIQLLLSSLHEEELARPALVATPRERAVIDFATAGSGNTTPRPVSARGRAASLTRASSSRSVRGSPQRPGSSHTSASAPERLKPVMKSITAFNVDKLRNDLRAALDEEADRLHEDIDFLQHLLEEENEVRSEATEQANAPSMPSVSDLRAYENKLQKVLSHQELRVRTEAMLKGGEDVVAPSSPARTPKLAPLRGSGSGAGFGAGLVPSPPTHKRTSGGGSLPRGSRTLVRAHSNGGSGSSNSLLLSSTSGRSGGGRPPVAPTSPKLVARTSSSSRLLLNSKPPLGSVGAGAGTETGGPHSKLKAKKSKASKTSRRSGSGGSSKSSRRGRSRSSKATSSPSTASSSSTTASAPVPALNLSFDGAPSRPKHPRGSRAARLRSQIAAARGGE